MDSWTHTTTETVPGPCLLLINSQDLCMTASMLIIVPAQLWSEPATKLKPGSLLTSVTWLLELVLDDSGVLKDIQGQLKGELIPGTVCSRQQRCICTWSGLQPSQFQLLKLSWHISGCVMHLVSHCAHRTADSCNTGTTFFQAIQAEKTHKTAITSLGLKSITWEVNALDKEQVIWVWAALPQISL